MTPRLLLVVALTAAMCAANAGRAFTGSQEDGFVEEGALSNPRALLLPPSLQPELAYYDAEKGVKQYDDLFYGSGLVFSWSDVFESERPGNTLSLDGLCQQRQAAGRPTSIWFDGVSCFTSQGAVSGALAGHAGDGGVDTAAGLYSSSDSAGAAAATTAAGARGSGAAFTAVWIGRIDEALTSSLPHGSCLHSPFRFVKELYAASADAAVGGSNRSSGLGIGVVPAPPANHWTLEVLTHQVQYLDLDERATASAASYYYRYGQGSADGKLRTWAVPKGLLPEEARLARGLAVGPIGSGGHMFCGDIALMMLYDRALEKDELQSLAAFYSTRFGWRTPAQ